MGDRTVRAAPIIHNVPNLYGKQDQDRLAGINPRNIKIKLAEAPDLQEPRSVDLRLRKAERIMWNSKIGLGTVEPDKTYGAELLSRVGPKIHDRAVAFKKTITDSAAYKYLSSRASSAALSVAAIPTELRKIFFSGRSEASSANSSSANPPSSLDPAAQKKAKEAEGRKEIRALHASTYNVTIPEFNERIRAEATNGLEASPLEFEGVFRLGGHETKISGLLAEMHTPGKDVDWEKTNLQEKTSALKRIVADLGISFSELQAAKAEGKDVAEFVLEELSKNGTAKADLNTMDTMAYLYALAGKAGAGGNIYFTQPNFGISVGLSPFGGNVPMEKIPAATTLAKELFDGWAKMRPKECALAAKQEG